MQLNDPHPVEVFANQFAMNLLMPEKDVRREFKRLGKMWINSKTICLADTFGVPIEVVWKRLRELGLIEGESR